MAHTEGVGGQLTCRAHRSRPQHVAVLECRWMCVYRAICNPCLSRWGSGGCNFESECQLCVCVLQVSVMCILQSVVYVIVCLLTTAQWLLC